MRSDWRSLRTWQIPLLLISLVSFNSSAFAQTVKVEPGCERSILAAQSRLQQGRRVSIKIDIDDQSSYIKGYPEDAPLRVNFLLEGAAANSLMNSPQFLKAITANIVTSCDSVSAVTFGVAYTGWTSTFGLMANKRIKEFDCVEPGVYRDFLPYGSQVCGI